KREGGAPGAPPFFFSAGLVRRAGRAGGCGRGEGGGRVGRDATERERGGRLSRDRAGVLPRQRMDGRWAVTERPHVPERAALGASGGGVARGGHDESRAGDWGPDLRDRAAAPRSECGVR